MHMEMENLILFFPISVLVFICALLFFAFKYSKSNSKTNFPPGSFGWPIIGETFSFINETQQRFVWERMKRYSPKLFKTNVFGEPTVVFCGIPGHKFIASNEEKLFLAWRPHSMQKLFRSSYQKAASQATIPRADAVQIYRAPGFLKSEALVRYIETMDSLVQEHLKLHWDGKSTVEVYHLAQLLVMTLSARFFTGLQNNLGRTEKFTELMNIITSGLHTVPLSIPGTTFYSAIKAADAMRKEVLLLIKEKKAAMSSGVQMHDIMSFMLFNADPTGRFVPENEVADKIMGLMAGGFHSPSMATSFLIKYLGENPEICDKVRTEQLEITRSKQSGEALNWDDIQKMKYSWGVALEVMRLVPPLQGTFREVITDFTYEGYTIPKGWKVYWSASSTNKVSEYFPAPEKFDPTRFENGKAPPAYSNIPFGSGPRICPGKEYARMQLLCSLHHIVTKYKWEVINPNAKIASGMNPVPEEGIHIRLQPY
ncbi:beta-amyrin 28-monooxygenase [Rosa chinensis]|nr:beta-amyrin 28-monooxygenase [Rosa chinensis]